MDKLTLSQSTVLQLQPVVSPVKFSLLHDDMIASQILSYFKVNQLIRAEHISRQFRDSIIKFYRSMKTINYMATNIVETYQVEGLINKVCCYMPNTRCFEIELHCITSVEPLSKLNLLQKLHTIRLTGGICAAEFRQFALSLKSMANNLHILDFGKLYLFPQPNGIPDRNFFNDFIMLTELRLRTEMCPYLPHITLPKLSIFQCGDYNSQPALLDQFCQKNLQVEELIIGSTYNCSLHFPSSAFAIFRNLRVLHATGYSIDGILAKRFVDSCRNVAKLSLRFICFISDDVMQIIFDTLSETMVQLELECLFNIEPVKAIQGIYKLQKLQHLVLRWRWGRGYSKSENAVAIDDLLVLKSLRVLHLDNFPLKFTSNSTALKFHSLEQLELKLQSKDIEYMKIFDFCTDGLKTLNIVDFNLTNKHLLQLCNNFPNLTYLHISIGKTTTSDTLKCMIGAFPKLRCLKIPAVGIEALLQFVQNCKFLTTIATCESDVVVLRNHRAIRIMRNSGRYIAIDNYIR